MRTKYLIITIVSMILAAVGCSPAKHCAAPDLSLPTSFVGETADSTTLADVEWWTLYSDTLLQNLIKRTLEYNKDMLIASERIEEMRHLHRVAKSDLFPSLSAGVSGEHEWTGDGGGALKSDPEITVQAKLSWEADLWGKLRWAGKQAAAEYLSTVEAKRAMQMTLIAEVATAYFELLALDNELKIVNRTLITRKEGVHQAKLRFEGGLTAETSYQQAKVELASTAAVIPELQRKIAVKESQISLLAGGYPDAVGRNAISGSSIYSGDIPLGVPSGLLQRRPDIRRAEQDLMAAQAAVGVAQAARFPSFVIDLSAGFETADFSSFFKSPLLNVAGDLAAPLFSFGKRKARFEASVSAYNQSRYEYEQTVLVAFKEVYDAVINWQTAKENTVLKRNLVEASEKYVNLARLQYINGVTRYLDVLDAQRKYFDAQVELSDALCGEHLAIVSLYKALGGGW